MDSRLSNGKRIRWRRLIRRRDWPPETETVLLTIEKEDVRSVTAAYWVDDFDNWSFLEWQPDYTAVAWTRLPEPLPF
jgi:hypothetical protein